MANRRRPVSKKLRFEVFKRDSFKCQYCGRAAPDVLLEADHIEPVKGGGGSEITNLITSCRDCNSGKGARKLSDDSVAAKSRAQISQLQERREQLDMLLGWRSGLRDIEGEELRKVAKVWASLAKPFYLTDTGLTRLRKLLKDFSAAEVVTAIETAAAKYLLASGSNTREAVHAAWCATGGICRINRDERGAPGTKDLYYIRGIFRKRMSAAHNYYGPDWSVIKSLKDAHAGGVSIEELRRISLTARNWTDFNYLIGNAAKECA